MKISNEKIIVGDVLLTSSCSFSSFFIRLFTGSLWFSHAALAINDGEIIEATNNKNKSCQLFKEEKRGDGVRIVSVNDFLNNNEAVWLLRREKKITVDEKFQFPELAKKHVGRKYNLSRAIGSGANEINKILLPIDFLAILLMLLYFWEDIFYKLINFFIWFCIFLSIIILNYIFFKYRVNKPRKFNYLIGNKKYFRFLKNNMEEQFCSQLVADIYKDLGQSGLDEDRDINPKKLVSIFRKNGFKLTRIK